MISAPQYHGGIDRLFWLECKLHMLAASLAPTSTVDIFFKKCQHLVYNLWLKHNNCFQILSRHICFSLRSVCACRFGSHSCFNNSSVWYTAAVCSYTRPLLIIAQGPWRLTANHVFSVFLHGQLLHACFQKGCSVVLVHHMPVLWHLHTLTMALTACCYTMLLEILSYTGAGVPLNTCLGVRCWRWYGLEAWACGHYRVIKFMCGVIPLFNAADSLMLSGKSFQCSHYM